MPIDAPDFNNVMMAALAGILVAGALLIIGHWLPLPDKRKLPQTVPHLLGRYIYGTLALTLGATVMLFQLDLIWLALALLAIDIAGGLVVTLAYFWDEIVLRWQQREMVQRADDELS